MNTTEYGSFKNEKSYLCYLKVLSCCKWGNIPKEVAKSWMKNYIKAFQWDKKTLINIENTIHEEIKSSLLGNSILIS